MVDAANNGPMVLKKLGGGANRKYWSMLVNSYAERGKGDGLRFPYQLFEDAFMEFLGELVAKDMVVPTADTKAATEKLEALQGRLASIESRLSVFQKRLLSDDAFEAILTATKTLEIEKKTKLAELHAIKQETAQPTSVDLLEEAQQLRKKLHTVKGDELLALRLKLRAVIRSLIDRIETRIFETMIDDKDARVLFADVHFRNGPKKLIAAIHERYSHSGSIGIARDEGIIAWSNFDGYNEKIDLRNLKRARVYQEMVRRFGDSVSQRGIGG
jgi:hypothetical protein